MITLFSSIPSSSFTKDVFEASNLRYGPLICLHPLSSGKIAVFKQYSWELYALCDTFEEACEAAASIPRLSRPPREWEKREVVETTLTLADLGI